MIIISTPAAATPYNLELPEIGRDYFLPTQKILENEYIATSGSPAGFFRQIVNYDLSSVKRKYDLVLDLPRAATLQAMITSGQNSFYCVTHGDTYEINMILIGDPPMIPLGPARTKVTLQFSIVRKVQ